MHIIVMLRLILPSFKVNHSTWVFKVQTGLAILTILTTTGYMFIQTLHSQI